MGHPRETPKRRLKGLAAVAAIVVSTFAVTSTVAGNPTPPPDDYDTRLTALETETATLRTDMDRQTRYVGNISDEIQDLWQGETFLLDHVATLEAENHNDHFMQVLMRVLIRESLAVRTADRVPEVQLDKTEKNCTDRVYVESFGFEHPLEEEFTVVFNKDGYVAHPQLRFVPPTLTWRPGEAGSKQYCILPTSESELGDVLARFKINYGTYEGGMGTFIRITDDPVTTF